MQQTETYKLNLIETSDTFSPDPLNENAQKLEAALNDETDARQTAADALDLRVTRLEGRKIAAGLFIGTGAIQRIDVGFRPTLVIAQQPGLTGDCFVATPAGGFATLTDTGFTMTNITSGPNSNGTRMGYVALS